MLALGSNGAESWKADIHFQEFSRSFAHWPLATTTGKKAAAERYEVARRLTFNSKYRVVELYGGVDVEPMLHAVRLQTPQARETR